MLQYTCFVFCVMAVSIANVHADGSWVPSTIEEIDVILLQCGIEHGVTKEDMRRVMQEEDVTIVEPCFWACCLKRNGFLNGKGQYVLRPGLTYVRKIIESDNAYSNLEHIAKRCKSVKKKRVSDGEAGCEMSALVVACFIEQLTKLEQRRLFTMW